MPTSSRDFQRAARQRLTTAEFLLENRYNLDAMYLAGYAVECTLKALILELTPVAGQSAMLKRISAGKSMHEAEVLGAILKDLGCPMPSRWSSDLGAMRGQRPCVTSLAARTRARRAGF